MESNIAIYQKRLNLQDAHFSRIEHEEAIVAIVYKITRPNGSPLIVKICERLNDYLREVYFLKHFAGKLPVPRIIQVVEPEKNIPGAILMECLPGALLTKADLNPALAHEIGTLLAQIHLNRTSGFGDLIQSDSLTSDPRVHFSLKFEEGLTECSSHLPQALIDKCRSYYHDHIKLLGSVDGPCMIHRDFRPGNLIIHNGKLQGIIDWSSARSSFSEEDFCPLENGEWSSNPSIKTTFLAGYSTIHPVPDYINLMPFLKLCRTIATIGFTVKRGTWNTTSAKLYATNRRFLDAFFD